MTACHSVTVSGHHVILSLSKDAPKP